MTFATQTPCRSTSSCRRTSSTSKDKLRRCRVDPCWEAMAQEIAGDVSKGRMEGPFSSPKSWPKQAVPLTTFSHTSKLAQGPTAHKPTCFAFAVHQVGSDGKPKVGRAEDWRRSFANATVGAKDSPTYHDIWAYVPARGRHQAEAPARAATHMGPGPRGRLSPTGGGRPRPHMGHFCQRHMAFTLWRHTVLMFGSVASVWAYCRIADLMSWLCRACLLTPALHFVGRLRELRGCRARDVVFRVLQETMQSFRFFFQAV